MTTIADVQENCEDILIHSAVTSFFCMETADDDERCAEHAAQFIAYLEQQGFKIVHIANAGRIN